MSMLNAAQSLLTPDVLSRMSATTGAPEGAVAKGLGAAIPLMLASLARHSADSTFMSQFASLAGRAPDVTTYSPADSWAHISSAESSGSAQNWLNTLFGAALPAVVSGLSRYAGVRNSTASSLLAMATPLLLSFFGRMMRSDGLDASSLADRIRRERHAFAAAVPRDLAALTTPKTPAVAADVIYHSTGETQGPWVVPVLVAALALGGLFWWWGSEHPPTGISTRTSSAVSEAVGTGGRVDFLTKRLPGNVSVKVPRDGMEDRLADYLGTSPTAAAVRSFDFDRIEFDTASAALTAASMNQIRDLATILRAYPSMHVTIAGYTDNVGDENANVELARSRAEVVVNALRQVGVQADRMRTRGYGSQSPVASNDTEEGRARNRRVALIVSSPQ